MQRHTGTSRNRLRIFGRLAAGYLFIIIVLNLSFWSLVGFHFEPVESLYDSGFELKIKPAGYAAVFVHGRYKETFDGPLNCTKSMTGNETCERLSTKFHTTYFQSQSYRTIDYLNQLKAEGYTHVWGTWCHSGDYDYLIKYPNGTEVPWPDWVSRNERPGRTIPVFLGLGFVRLSVE